MARIEMSGTIPKVGNVMGWSQIQPAAISTRPGLPDP